MLEAVAAVLVAWDKELFYQLFPCSHSLLAASSRALGISADEQRLLVWVSTLRCLESQEHVNECCRLVAASRYPYAIGYWRRRLWRYADLQEAWLAVRNLKQTIGRRETSFPVKQAFIRALVLENVPFDCGSAPQDWPDFGKSQLVLATSTCTYPWRFCQAQRFALVNQDWAGGIECGADELAPLLAKFGVVRLASGLTRSWNLCLAGETPRSDAALRLIELANLQQVAPLLLWRPPTVATTATTFRQLHRWMRALSAITAPTHLDVGRLLCELGNSTNSIIIRLLLFHWALRLAPDLRDWTGIRQIKYKADEALCRELTIDELRLVLKVNYNTQPPFKLMKLCVQSGRYDLVECAWAWVDALERSLVPADIALRLFESFDPDCMLLQLRASRYTKHYNPLLHYCLRRADTLPWAHKLPRFVQLARPRDALYHEIMTLAGQSGWW